MDRLFFLVGSLFGCLGVVLGAFGAHTLKGQLSADQLIIFEVGVRYQMYHAFALLAAGWAHSKWPGVVLITSGWLFIAGTVLFSGSLYALSLSGAKWLGAITPLGGLAFVIGWLFMAWSAWRR